MGLSLSESVHWALTAVLEAGVVLLALRRHLFRQLPFLTLYLLVLVLNEAVMWSFYRFTGFQSYASFSAYWTMQAVQVTGRAIVVYEICRFLLQDYTGIWRLCRPFLLTLAAALVADAVFSARASSHGIATAILMAERGLELVILGILIFGLAFCRYYAIRIPRHIGWIGLGLGFYSAVEVANNTVLQRWAGTYFPVWENLRHASFNVATICWCVALLAPLPAVRPAPILLNRYEYENLRPFVTTKLRELNTRLLEMWK